MRLFVSDLGNWGIINEETFGFTIVNCDYWEEEDFKFLDDTPDSSKPITALAIQQNILRDREQEGCDWGELTGKIDELFKLADKTGSVEIHALAVDIRDAVGL